MIILILKNICFVMMWELIWSILEFSLYLLLIFPA